ncbi:hypothetical protein IWW37_002377 [Coemansia sp. RSA 2050]|nr:hypothetical protein IWW37_002377 [Coemansia sp. RSA 2050]
MSGVNNKSPAQKLSTASCIAQSALLDAPIKASNGDKDGADSEKEVPVAPVPISPMRRIIITISLSLSILLIGIDVSIVTTVIPKVAHEFNALSSAAWIATAYMVTLTALQPLFGRLSDIFGRATSLIGSILLFLAGSVAAGWAKSMGGLIFGRALQGVGGAGIETMVLTIVSDITTVKERPVLLGIVNAVWLVSSVAGPLLGGVFSDHLSWRWAFLINLPVGAVLLVLMGLLLRLPKPTGSLIDKIKRVDMLGSLVLIGGVTMLLLALNWGGNSYAWSSARITNLLVFSCVLLGLFLVVEWRVAKQPTIPIFIVLGLALLLIGSGLILMNESTSSGKEVAFLLLMGVGIGLSIQLPLMIAQKSSPEKDLAATTSLYTFMRIFGYSVGVAILQSIMQNSLEPRLNSLAQQTPDYLRAILDTANDQTKIYSSDLPDALRVLLVHAFSRALHRVFIATVPFAAISFILALPIDYTIMMPDKASRNFD